MKSIKSSNCWRNQQPDTVSNYVQFSIERQTTLACGELETLAAKVGALQVVVSKLVHVLVEKNAVTLNELSEILEEKVEEA